MDILTPPPPTPNINQFYRYVKDGQCPLICMTSLYDRTWQDLLAIFGYIRHIWDLILSKQNRKTSMKYTFMNHFQFFVLTSLSLNSLSTIIVLYSKSLHLTLTIYTKLTEIHRTIFLRTNISSAN